MEQALQDLIAVLDLEPLEENIFRGQSHDIGTPHVFGGLVLGQALAAASRTVEGRTVHSLHAYFLRRGDINAPIIYEVDRARDGAGFSNRRVVAIQHGEQIFNMAASFQVPETGLEHQSEMPAVADPDTLLDMEGRWPGPAARICPPRLARFLNYRRPLIVKPVEPRQFLSTENLEPIKRVWMKAIDRLPPDECLHRELLAVYLRLRTDRHRDLAPWSACHPRRSEDGQPRSRHVVSPPRQGGPVAVVRPGQPHHRRCPRPGAWPCLQPRGRARGLAGAGGPDSPAHTRPRRPSRGFRPVVRASVNLRAIHVALRGAGQPQPFLGGELPRNFCRRADDQDTVREGLALGDQRAGADDGVRADVRVIHDDGADADERVITDMAAVEHHHVADGDHFPQDRAGPPGRSAARSCPGYWYRSRWSVRSTSPRRTAPNQTLDRAARCTSPMRVALGAT